MDSIEKICAKHINTSAINNCNHFVQAVAKELWSDTLPSSLAGRANDILAQLAVNGSWLNLGNGHDSATSHAVEGYFVVGGVTDTTGHVFVVVPGGPSPKGVATPWINRQTQQPFLSRGGLPMAFNGSSNPPLRIKHKIGVDLMFSAAKFSEIRYYAIPDPRKTTALLKPSAKLALFRQMEGRNA